jgi:hypothetical protein
MTNVYFVPSFYAHVTNGLLLFVAIVFLYSNFKSIKNIDSYKKLILIILFSIAIGIHGLGHLGLEYVYNYNPLTFSHFNFPKA